MPVPATSIGISEEQRLVVLFAAGNDGTDINDGKGMWPSDLWVLRLPQRIVLNSITVRASESIRSDVEYPGIPKGLTYGDV
jgi:hypothetical protein